MLPVTRKRVGRVSRDGSIAAVGKGTSDGWASGICGAVWDGGAVEAGATVAIGDLLDERGRETARTLGDAALYVHLDVASDAGPLGDRCAVRQAQTRSEVESAIKARGADVYAGFLLPYLRPDMSVLDCGCGKATITLGLAEAVPNGRVFGVDLDRDSLLAARYSAVLIGRGNLACILADGRQLPFHDAAFDAVLCHSMLETLDDPANVMTELRRVTKHGGVVGAASVDYGGLILGGDQTAGPRRFYDIREQVWRAMGIAEPNMGRRLRGLFQEAGFGSIEAFADYVSYGTPDRIRAFAHDRATECRDQELQAAATRHGIASVDELLHLAAAWGDWSKDPGAFFAFAWCRVLAWP